MNALKIRHRVVPFAIGLLTAVLMQWAGGWWLNSGRGVVITMAVLFGVALVVSLWSEASWHQAAALCMGSVGGMAATLFWIGPGTIWPIVLVVASALTIAAVFAGAGVAHAIRHRR